ncbi:MAG: EF-hand domain-containing protein [Myxococcales bacterium]|nr:EF-hand domain-containing protein [Myxococcales bacterium]
MEPSELQEIFEAFDRDNNGKIDYDEFGQLMEALGAELSEQEKRIGFDAIDLNKNALIEFREFAAWWGDR